jgi:hypothetical protein
VGLLAERALGVGFGRGGEERAGADDDGEADDAVPVSGTRAERDQVMLHVEPATLAATGEPGRAPTATGGWSELEDGTRVSAKTSRRLSCDAALVRVAHAPDAADRHDEGAPSTSGAPRPLAHRRAPAPLLSVGRRTRTIPPALRRALEVRDRGCRFPACGLRFTDAHHVKHWADGGETSLSNCLLQCRHHHRLVHEEGWQVGWWGEGRPVFFDPRGGAHYEGRWEPPEGGGAPEAGERANRGATPALGSRPVEALLEKNERSGASPDGWTASSRWKRERDIPDRVLFAVLEAMG